MRIPEILPLHFAGANEVVDISPGQIHLSQHLGVPEGLAYRRCAAEDAEGFTPSAGTVLVSLVGPHALAHNSPEALAPALRRLRAGNRALLLPAWPIDELPYHLLLGPLVDASCQVVEAVPLDTSSIREVHCALVVECVDRLVPPRAYLVDGEPETGEAELPTLLRLANEYVLGDLVARSLRRRLVEMDQRVTESGKGEAGSDNEAVKRLAEREARLRETERELAKAQRRVAELESSTTLQIGQAVVRGARHPVRAVVSVPMDLARLWRSRRRRQLAAPGAGASAPAVQERVVPIALPKNSHGRELMTMTTPKDLFVPRKLAEQGLAGYEPGAMACFLAAIDVAGPGAVLDIGANVGIYAALASAVTGRDVRAFEPTPSLVAVSQRLAVDNALQYTTESLALGAENGTATFYLSDRTDASNSLAAGFRKSSRQLTVPVETLDSYVARTGIVPAVMKVDTETTEPDVLAGAAKTITEHRPWILCEVLAGRVEERLTEVVAPFGYHWYHVTDQGPYQESGEIVGDRTHEYLMWLFAPEPLNGRFWTVLRARLAAVAECTPRRAADLVAGAGQDQ